MSTGQASIAEDQETERFYKHAERLHKLGYVHIARYIQDLTEAIYRLEETKPALTRTGWYAIDNMKTTLRKMS